MTTGGKMEYLFLALVAFAGEIIGCWEKPWKAKILPLLISYAVACILLMIGLAISGSKGNRLLGRVDN